jgi:hypothetical protein
MLTEHRTSSMRMFYVMFGLALAVLLNSASPQAAEPHWSVGEVKTHDDKLLAFFATNGSPAAINPAAQGNFRIGCSKGARHIFLTTSKMLQDTGKIAPTGFADIDFRNGSPALVIEGRFAVLEDAKTVNFIADGVEKAKFDLITKSLMSGVRTMRFRMRDHPPNQPGFIFSTEIGVGTMAARAVAEALRECRYR